MDWRVQIHLPMVAEASCTRNGTQREFPRSLSSAPEPFDIFMHATRTSTGPRSPLFYPPFPYRQDYRSIDN